MIESNQNFTFMKRLLVNYSIIYRILSLSFAVAPAQEEARAAWQVTNFDVTANVQQAERVLSTVAVLSATNVGRGAGLSFTFRINAKASHQNASMSAARTQLFERFPKAPAIYSE